MPFEFVLGRLDPLKPILKPMFGCHAIYIGEKIVIVLRNKNEGTEDNGIWLATQREHHPGLSKDFPSLRSIRILGGENSAWQLLPLEADDFEESAMKLCDMILHHDPRIGKVPKSKVRPQKKRVSNSGNSGRRL